MTDDRSRRLFSIHARTCYLRELSRTLEVTISASVSVFFVLLRSLLFGCYVVVPRCRLYFTLPDIAVMHTFLRTGARIIMYYVGVGKRSQPPVKKVEH